MRIIPLLVAGLVSAADLLILSPPALVDAWRYYAASRRTAGLSVDVVETSSIYANHPFGASEPCRTAADSLHAFIHASAAAGTTNFLLGGAWIDARALERPIHLLTGERLSLSNAVPGVLIRPHGATGLEAAPSDFFYACSGATNWDANGNGVLLEPDERRREDLFADVVVGRFPALPFAFGDRPLVTAAELVTNYAAKVARGLSPAFTGRHRVNLAGGTQWSSVPAADTSLGLIREEMQFFDALPNVWQTAHLPQVSDAEFVLRKTLRTIICPYWPVEAVDAVFYSDAALYGGSYENLLAARDAFLAHDAIVSSCRTHGNATVALSAGGLFLFSQSLYAKARGLSLFADFAVPCRTGMIDYTSTSNQVVYAVPSLGVAAVCSPVGGAVTGVFNSRDGIDTWTVSFALEDGLSLSLATGTLRHLFAGESATFGTAFLRARRDFVTQSPKLSNDQVYALGEQLFLGDPTIGLPSVEKSVEWTESPVDLTTDQVWVSAHLNAGSDALITGAGDLRVMGKLAVAGTNLTLAVGGGLGEGVAFTGTVPGTLTLAGESSFYVGGVSNCATVVVASGSPTLRCTNPRYAPQSFRVEGGCLVLETAETFTPSHETLAEVVNGRLVWAESPQAGWSEGGEHLARPLKLADGILALDPAARLTWGRHEDEALAPFTLVVEGTSRVEVSVEAAAARVGLVGTTTVALASGAELVLDVACEDEENGALVATGPGVLRATRRVSLAGRVEVSREATLVLEEAPLVSVTDLVVRAGGTLRIPAVASGRHPLVPLGGRVVLEAGARVTDLAGNVLAGSVANGTFFELSSALRWKGGAGVWSDPQGWFDSGTGEFGVWQPGRTAVFDAPQGACVTNDARTVDVAGFIVATDAMLCGGTIRSSTGELAVPEGATLTFQAPFAVEGDVRKGGGGRLALSGEQRELGPGALVIDAGPLALSNVVAPCVTNVTVANGAFIELSGVNELAHAISNSSLATNALVRVDEAPSSLVFGLFTPRKSFRIPSGVTLEVRGPIADDGGRAWWPQVEGTLAYRGVLTGAYGQLTGTGTVQVAGLRSRSGSGMGFGPCRLVWQPESSTGLFPLLGFYLRYTAFIVLNGTTVAPGCDCVKASAEGAPDSEVALYVEEDGATFEIPGGQTLVLEDDGSHILFGGPGPVRKTGTGIFRLAGVDDQHTGATFLAAGTYSVEGECFSPAFELAPGSVLDLSAPYPTQIEATNFVWSAGAEIRLCVSADGCDRLDLRTKGDRPSGSDGDRPLGWKIPGEGECFLTVKVESNAHAGDYLLIIADEIPDRCWSRLARRFVGAAGRRARLARTPDRRGVVLTLGPPSTVILLR